MAKMVPADETTMSPTGSLLRVFIYCFFSRIVEFDVNDIFIFTYIYIWTRFAEIYWYNNNNNNNNNNICQGAIKFTAKSSYFQHKRVLKKVKGMTSLSRTELDKYLF